MRMKFNMMMNSRIIPLALFLSGCAFFSPHRQNVPDQGIHEALVRDRIRYEAEASSGRPGAYVCRKMKVGISEVDWIKGTVRQVMGEKIEVQVDDPGRYPHQVNGAQISEGTIVRDEEVNWIPCVK